MTMIIDKELLKWIDNDISIDSRELKLKDGAPEKLKIKLEEWKKSRDDYELSWTNNN